MLFGTSWKMNKTRPEAAEWVAEVCPAVAEATANGHQLFVVPPYTAIATVIQALEGTAMWVGAQDVSTQPDGARTGEVSARMLAELGCDLVEVGHSERRAHHGETDADVNAKARQILDHGMRPLVCVGETMAGIDRDHAARHVTSQARAALAGTTAAEAARCFLAYEPAWAIGTGNQPATPAQIEPVTAALAAAHPSTPVLYGGSVDAGTAAALARVAGVAGLFVGRAGLTAAGFLATFQAALAGAAD